MDWSLNTVKHSIRGSNLDALVLQSQVENEITIPLRWLVYLNIFAMNR